MNSPSAGGVVRFYHSYIPEIAIFTEGQDHNDPDIEDGVGFSTWKLEFLTPTSGMATLIDQYVFGHYDDDEQPYSANAIKRLTKTPKLYFMDTGAVRLAGGVDERKSTHEGAYGRGYSGNLGVWAADKELQPQWETPSALFLPGC